VADGSTIGALAIVPASGLTHAASGIGEAMLAGIPMIVITGGIRNDTGHRYQLHEIDQLQIAKALTKAAYRVMRHADVVPTIFEAARIALSGEPGPVFVELPLDVLLFPGEIDGLPNWLRPMPPRCDDAHGITRAADLLLAARNPGIFVGWGGRGASDVLIKIAERLGAPVATTLQGLASFPHDHPLHAGFSFGNSAVPAAQNAFANCDCLLAIGARFGEIATGSYGVKVPPHLIHIDINPAVFDANYPAAVKLVGDAKLCAELLLAELEMRAVPIIENKVTARIATDKAAYRQSWYRHDTQGRVNPARFFDELRRQLPNDAIAAVDDGNHTYLTAELFPIYRGGKLILPTDFNAMGYAVPAAMGAKLVYPEREVVAIVGDGAFMMTCMEIVTAASLQLGIVYFVFHDGELAQIAQAQQIPYGRKPCTTLGTVNIEGIAIATGAAYVRVDNDAGLNAAITEARALAAAKRPVIVDVIIDYSKRTAFTSGAVKTNFQRFSLSQKMRMLTRAVTRKITG
ncbi:MAG TPA: thiamine pyrophosphate-binding protein, partial [Spongiibacteraceae bacterium]|nr:thiamine pyrophosphate-binding protein [Spongiibacteraceae bacterium]